MHAHRGSQIHSASSETSLTSTDRYVFSFIGEGAGCRGELEMEELKLTSTACDIIASLRINLPKDFSAPYIEDANISPNSCSPAGR